MAPIKFEENIKDKLEKRKIEPSDAVRNKLSDKLDAAEGKSNNKIVWWLGIAASLAGVLLVTTMFFKQDESEKIKPILVDSPVDETTKQQQEIPVKNVVVVNEKTNLEQDKSVPEKTNTSIVNQKIVRQNFYETPRKDKLQKNDIASIILKENNTQNNNLINSNTIIKDENKLEMVAHIPEIEKENGLVTDAEIESLLINAQKEITSNKIRPVNTKTVDANTLLQDVETDLEKSFRDKVFKTIINGYNTVKTAVVERND